MQKVKDKPQSVGIAYHYESFQKAVSELAIFDPDTKESYAYQVYQFWKKFTPLGDLLPDLTREELEFLLHIKGTEHMANPLSIARAYRKVLEKAIELKIDCLIPSEETLKRRKKWETYCKYYFGHGGKNEK